MNNFDYQIYKQTIKKITNNSHNNIVDLYVFDCLDSTNTKLWQLIDGGATIPVSAIALKQTSGKGQWGKVWQSKAGGLYLSVGIQCDLALNNYFHLIMATARGVTNSLRNYEIPVSIKWCNDLILNNRKLGGIKIETRTKNNVIKYAVIGVGINWNNEVPDIGINLTSHYAECKKHQKINSLEELAAITTVGILSGYYDYLKLGINYTFSQYQQLLNSIGKQIIINSSKGTILGVNTQGQLRVHLKSLGATTEVCLSPGEISLGYK